MKNLFFDRVTRIFILILLLLHVLLLSTVGVNAQELNKGGFEVVETYRGKILTLKDVREITRIETSHFVAYEWLRDDKVYKLTLYRNVLKDNVLFVYMPETGGGVLYESIDNEFLTFFNK